MVALGYDRLVGSRSRSKSQIRRILQNQPNTFFADLGCCHVDEVKNGADRSPKRGTSRTDRPRRTKSQQKSTRRMTMSIKMIFTHHIRTKVTFGSDGSSQPCSRGRVARIQIRRIWIRIRPIDHCRSSGSDGSGSGSDQTITALDCPRGKLRKKIAKNAGKNAA